jgi:hypothetical protein
MNVIFVITMLSAVTGSAVTDIGSRKQLFIDQKWIESSEGVHLVLQQPIQLHEKLVTADAPWEADAHLGSYSTIVQENGKIRLWYDVRAGVPEPGKNPPFMGLAYAESSDGIHFEKKPLRLVERNGSRENNLVLPPRPDWLTLGGGTVWRDDNPNAAPDARYKSWSKMYAKPGSPIRGPHRLWKSPDGLTWTHDERPMTGLRAADTQPSWFWDARIGRYIGYSREWIREKPGFGARLASYNESDDMVNWTAMHFSLGPDERDASAAPAMQLDPDQLTVNGEDVFPSREERTAGVVGEDQVLTPMLPIDFYGPGVFPYEDVYLALIPVFYHWKGSAEGTFPSTSDIQLAVSRDARHFTRPGPRRAFLSTGMNGTWDSRWIYPVLRPVRMNDQLWIYYMGTNHDHAGLLDPESKQVETALSRAILRLDGFVAAEADYEGGTFMTPPLQFHGTTLELNLDTGAGGVTQVEILRESGEPLPGYRMVDADELNGNSVKMVASWNGGKTDVGSLAGQPVRLRFRMRAAKLFAFQFQ